MAKPEDSPYIAWIDLETTGNHEGAVITEIGAVMTDRDFNELAAKQIVTHYPIHLVQELDPVVQEMHTKNGLWVESEASEIDVAKADEMMVEWIKGFTNGDHIPLAGSGVSHFDKPDFIEPQLPKLDNYLSYWSYDVGTFRRMLKLFGIPIVADKPKEGLNHRALDDIRAHIQETKGYKDQLRAYFFPPPMFPSVWQANPLPAKYSWSDNAGKDSAGNPI
jgi:oligoribonuclease